jgi:hypothetical protein
MEKHFTVRERANILPVLLFVGYVHHTRVTLNAVLANALLQFAELTSKGNLFSLRQCLPWKTQDTSVI